VTFPNIRPAEPSDRATIRSIHKSAFGQSAEADLVDALIRDGHAATSLVASGPAQSKETHFRHPRPNAPVEVREGRGSSARSSEARYFVSFG
jgi:hypothetical protein